jgi:hypothetical protein
MPITTHTRAIRTARCQARAKSLKDGNAYFIDPAFMEGGTGKPLTQIRHREAKAYGALHWYFPVYGEKGNLISTQDLLKFLEDPNTQLTNARFLEVPLGGLAHFTRGGYMFLPLNHATCRLTTPYQLSLSTTKEIEYCPMHIGLKTSDTNIRDNTEEIKVTQKDYSPRDLFDDLIWELNETTQPGKRIAAAKARRIPVLGTEFTLDGFTAELIDDTWRAT